MTCGCLLDRIQLFTNPWTVAHQAPLSMVSVQFSLVTQSCLTICDPMNRSMPGLPFHHQLPELIQTNVHQAGDAIQPSHPLLSPSPPAPNPSYHQGLFQWVSSSHEVAKVLEFQLQHQSFQWTPRDGLDISNSYMEKAPLYFSFINFSDGYLDWRNRYW